MNKYQIRTIKSVNLSMKEEVKTKRTIRQVESFKEDGVFYSFKYEYSEIFGDGQKFFEIKTPITVLVENEEKKRLFFNFKPDTSSDSTSYGKLSVVAREEQSESTPKSFTRTDKKKEEDLIRVQFNSLSESTQFTAILNRVHSECVKIISSKFKDVVTANDAKSFFS